MNQNDTYLKTDDLVRIYGVHHRTIRRWVQSGKVRSIKIGKYYFFPREDHQPTTVGVIKNPTYKGKNAFELSKEIIEASKKGNYGPKKIKRI